MSRVGSQELECVGGQCTGPGLGTARLENDRVYLPVWIISSPFRTCNLTQWRYHLQQYLGSCLLLRRGSPSLFSIWVTWSDPGGGWKVAQSLDWCLRNGPLVPLPGSPWPCYKVQDGGPALTDGVLILPLPVRKRLAQAGLVAWTDSRRWRGWIQGQVCPVGHRAAERWKPIHWAPGLAFWEMLGSTLV